MSSRTLKLDVLSFDAARERIAAPPEKAPLTLVLFAGADLAMGSTAASLAAGERERLEKAAQAARFKGKAGSSLEILAPPGLNAARLLIVGVAPSGEGEEAKPFSDYLHLGGQVVGKCGQASRALVIFDFPAPPQEAALEQFMLGARLRAYKFDAYKTKKKKDDEPEGDLELLVAAPAIEAARAADEAAESVAGGVLLARTLVNEPANVLTPSEFARRAGELASLGVEIETLGEKEMEALAMGALLGVGKGSEEESKLVVMRWNGGTPGAVPVAFVGKGVVFDTGGISIKPAASMEDMKGDMAGAAAVTGLMRALASRKAKANVVGVIGLVENMPDGKAQRPGDIVTSMSGQTIEVINTDAEGRLVLADALWFVKEKYKPAFIIDLATLTGAILVALGQEHAGLFSNNDELADRILGAGVETGEKLWRLPLGPAYDKLIDSKFADMKNTGGRHAGSITAAHFLQRFVDKTPWAHLDIAGTGMSSPASDINQSWGSGWGVRLLDRLVRDHYER